MDNLASFNGVLNQNHVLYSILKSNPPDWWNGLKNDNDLYIEIRKGDIIDVYYNGGRLAEIKYNRNKIVVCAHPKYLGLTNKYDKSYYREHLNKEGKLVHSPIYQDCLAWISSKEKLQEMKANVELHYSGSNNGEDTKEKYIQSRLIINGRDTYLDSEFAHRLYITGRNTIRFDMVKIVGDRIVFEELKRIKDNRLRTIDGTPEILTQMGNYQQFLQYNAFALLKYFQTLFLIKKELGLPVPAVTNIDDVEMDFEPQLLIVNNYNNLRDGRKKRIEDIENILTKGKIKYEIRNI